MKNLLIISLFMLFTIVAYSQQTMEEIYGNSPISAENFSPITTKSAKGAVGIPFYTGFETGILDTCFTFSASSSGGRYMILKDSVGSFGTTSPHSGLYYLVMDCSSGTYTENNLDLHLDLAGETEVVLDFWWTDFNDETEAQDGVWISDNGSTFTQIIPLPGASYVDLQWYHFQIDLDSAATANGLSLNSSFVIRFTQYDNYYIHGGNDGHIYDDISVYDPIITAISSSKRNTPPQIYPNPVTDFCSITYNIKEESQIDIQVFDILGKLCYSHSLLKANSGSYRENLDFSLFESCLYLLNLKINDNTTVHKIIKQ
jgi:hypothetical protein